MALRFVRAARAARGVAASRGGMASGPGPLRAGMGMSTSVGGPAAAESSIDAMGNRKALRYSVLATIGFAAGAAYAYPRTPYAESKAAEGGEPAAKGEKPKPKTPPEAYDVAKSGGHEPLKDIPKDITLYQYEVCPFCNKVKAILDFYDLPYKCVEVNPLMKGELKWSEYKKVPTVMVDGQQFNDSSAIMSAIHKVMQEKKRAGSWFGFGKSGGIAEEEKWRKWVDEHLVHVLTVNIYQNTAESRQAFHYITEEGNFGWLERQGAYWAGAAAMFFVAKSINKKHQIGEARPALFECADTWVGGLGHRPFMGGGEPNLADVSVFGVLRAIVKMDAWRDMMEHSPDMRAWYERMAVIVGPSTRIRDE